MFLLLLLLFILLVLIFVRRSFNPDPNYSIDQKVDSLNGVYVYFNGGVGNMEGRNTSVDGYNLGLKYQCVEFVKRYYYEYYEMPDAYGNAKDFF